MIHNWVKNCLHEKTIVPPLTRRNHIVVLDHPGVIPLDQMTLDYGHVKAIVRAKRKKLIRKGLHVGFKYEAHFKGPFTFNYIVLVNEEMRIVGSKSWATTTLTDQTTLTLTYRVEL